MVIWAEAVPAQSVQSSQLLCEIKSIIMSLGVTQRVVFQEIFANLIKILEIYSIILTFKNSLVHMFKKLKQSSRIVAYPYNLTSSYSEVYGVFSFHQLKIVPYCCCLVVNLCSTLLPPQGLQPTKLLCPWAFRGKNIGIGCHFLLQGIFLTLKLNCVSCIGRQILLLVSHQGDQLFIYHHFPLPCLACFGLNFLFFHHYLQGVEGE